MRDDSTLRSRVASPGTVSGRSIGSCRTTDFLDGNQPSRPAADHHIRWSARGGSSCSGARRIEDAAGDSQQGQCSGPAGGRIMTARSIVAIWSAVVSLTYLIVSITSPTFAEGLVVAFVALLLIPATFVEVKGAYQ